MTKVTIRVGPVLQGGRVGEAVVSALRTLNPDVEIVDRGSYVRVLVPDICRVTREAIERAAGRHFELPGDLERIMPSFQGRFRVDDTEAVWWAEGERFP